MGEQDGNYAVMMSRLAFFNHKEDEKNEQEGHVEYAVMQTGTYGICFDNTMSRWTAKTVSFFIPTIKGCVTQFGSPSQPSEDMAKLEHLTPFVESVIHLSDELEAVEKMQHHMRVRETFHRDSMFVSVVSIHVAAESTNSRVMWLSLLESVVLLTISGFQLFYIRNWFSDTDRRRRV